LRVGVHATTACGRHRGRLRRGRSVPRLLLRVARLLPVTGLLLRIARLLPVTWLLLRIAGLLLRVTGLLLPVARLAVPRLLLLPTLRILRRGFLFFASPHGDENERGSHHTGSH